MKCLVLVGAIALALGCGSAPAKKPVAAPESKPAAVAPAATPSPPSPPSPPPAAVTADSFADSAEAVNVLVRAVSDSNSEEFARAQSWLLLQEAEAIPAVTHLVRDATAPLFARTAGCKILSQLGPEAIEPLLDATQDVTPRVQQEAIKQLGNVRPTSPQVTSKLIELTQGTDTEIRLSAILGLINLDPPAEDSAEVMVAILNNTSEPDSLRSAAKECLKKVNPRKTFND